MYILFFLLYTHFHKSEPIQLIMKIIVLTHIDFTDEIPPSSVCLVKVMNFSL